MISPLRNALTILSALAVVTGCGKDAPTVPRASGELTVISDLSDPRLATLTLENGGMVTFFGERDASGVPISIEQAIVAGPQVAPFQYLSFEFPDGDSMMRCVGSDGSFIEVTAADTDYEASATIFDASTRLLTTIPLEDAPLSEGPEPKPIVAESILAGAVAANRRTLKLLCQDGESFRGALAVVGNLRLNTGEDYVVRLRRDPKDKSLFTFSLPGDNVAVPGVLACASLLDKLLAYGGDLARNRLWAALCRVRTPRVTPIQLAACAAFTAIALIDLATHPNATDALTMSCADALNAVGGTLDLHVTGMNLDYDASIPADWSNPLETVQLTLIGGTADEVTLSDPYLVSSAGYTCEARVTTFCFSRSETRFRLQVQPLSRCFSFEDEVTVVPSSQGIAVLKVSGLQPCCDYFVSVTRSDAGRDRVLAINYVDVDESPTDRIRYDPDGFISGGVRFHPETVISLSRSRREGSSGAGVDIDHVNSNGKIDFKAHTWHALTFFHGITNPLEDLAVSCDAGGIAVEFVAGARLSGLGSRDDGDGFNDGGDDVPYSVKGKVRFRIVNHDAYDEITGSFECTDDQNCDVAESGPLFSMRMPREHAIWNYLP